MRRTELETAMKQVDLEVIATDEFLNESTQKKTPYCRKAIKRLSTCAKF